MKEKKPSNSKITTTSKTNQITPNNSATTNETVTKPNEMDLLRKDCKNLLSSLHKHQSILNESLNLSKTKSKKSPITSVSSAATKTVSFSGFSDTHRTRSVSPFAKTTPTTKPNPAKSILKKQLVQDVLSDQEDERCGFLSTGRVSTSGSCHSVSGESSHSSCSSHSVNSASTGSLLASDIYGNAKPDYEDTFGDLVKYRNWRSASNLHSFVEYIEKKRQGYLNHSYDSVSASYTNPADSGLFAKFVKNEPEKKGDAVRVKGSAPSGQKETSVSYAKPTLSSLNMAKSGAVVKENGKVKAASKPSSVHQKKRNYKKMAKNAKKNRPLLGFDWALGKLEIRLLCTFIAFIAGKFHIIEHFIKV
jgi:hypothetical protein